MDYDLRNLLQTRQLIGLQPLVDALNADILPAAIMRYNSEFSPRYFGRPPEEPIPTERRRLTEFRTRLGPLIEYGLGVCIDTQLQDPYREELRLSFVVNTQYPDFYLRNSAGAILLRIDCKALHDESVEFSARFDHPTSQINPVEDLLMYIAWQWQEIRMGGWPLVYPYVLDGLFVPAIEIAHERDLHLLLRGGRFTPEEKPVVPPNDNTDTNFGKINRIVHNSRRTAELTPNVRAFLDFTQRYAEAVRRAGRAAAPSPTPDELSPD